MKVSIKSIKGFAFIILTSVAPFTTADISLPALDSEATLTLSGLGYWNQQRYAYGDSPSISSIDSSGQRLEDGVYQYELKRRMEAPAGFDNGGITLVAPPVSASSTSLATGTFTIQNGSLIEQN